MTLKLMTELIRLALMEDVGPGDITTEAIVPKSARSKAIILAKADGVIAGLPIAEAVLRQVDAKVKFTSAVKDGSLVKKGKVIATLEGPTRAILTGERVALNFLQRLSGIATLTQKFVKKVESRKLKVESRVSNVERRTQILDTRKTTPGLRLLEKYAVQCGGGINHRLGLYDAILIKDNHIAAAGGVKEALAKFVNQVVEIEAKTLTEVKEAITGKADRILLDNMSLATMRQAVKLCKKAGVETEASGGVNLSNVKAIAKTGVDYISVGALTHSAPALDISLEIV